MNKIKSLSLAFFLFVAGQSIGQDHFKVDLSNRAPDVKTMVMSFEGSSSIPFLANDVNGVEQSLSTMQGKTVLLYFWHNDCIRCHEQLSDLNKLTANYPDNLKVVSFSTNTKEEIKNFTNSTKVDFPIIPNSKTLSEGPYGGDLGYPKLFILDKSGMIKWVLPEMEMRGDFGTYKFLETLHVSLHKKS